MIDGAMPQKTGTAVRLLLYDRTSRGNWRGSVRIGGTKNGNNRQAYRRCNVHRAGIVADEKMTTGEQSWKIRKIRLANQGSHRARHSSSDGVGHLPFRSRTEKNHV